MRKKEEDGKIYSDEYVKYTFTEPEKREIANEMAQKVSEANDAENQKKAVVADFKSRIESLSAQIQGAATKLNNGYEMRQMRCELIPDYKRGVWDYFRVDNGELVKSRGMTADEKQSKMFEDEAA